MQADIKAKQSWQADLYANHGGYVAELGRPLLALLGEVNGKKVLDLGCGDGVLAAQLMAQGAHVVGLDSSSELLEQASKKGVKVVQADGQHFTLSHEFDAVLSNAALHWMPQADAVLRSVHAHLRSKGRFVGEFGGYGNVAAIITAINGVLKQHNPNHTAQHPWFFPTPENYRQLLEKAGFVVENIQLTPRPTPLGEGIRGWLSTFADPFLALAPDMDRDHFYAEVEALLKPCLMDTSGNWMADYVRLRFVAHRAT
ncbi:class I SAM-dependent methyltransferase [Magnetococcus sp. PR-3]|uniref:class I SAM-dependent methyltransferase n=1 Tax=Magnetococcus sp. PR-3 TaxID=3120355 RepID=UPI002FCDE4C6